MGYGGSPHIMTMSVDVNRDGIPDAMQLGPPVNYTTSVNYNSPMNYPNPGMQPGHAIMPGFDRNMDRFPDMAPMPQKSWAQRIFG